MCLWVGEEVQICACQAHASKFCVVGARATILAALTRIGLVALVDFCYILENDEWIYEQQTPS